MRIPPLSERKQDIPALSEAFCDEQRNALKRNITISEETKEALMAYRWPGNVRELRNAIEFSVNSMEGTVIEPRHLPYRMQAHGQRPETVSVKKLSEAVRGGGTGRDIQGPQDMGRRYGGQEESRGGSGDFPCEPLQ